MGEEEENRTGGKEKKFNKREKVEKRAYIPYLYPLVCRVR